MVSILRKPAAGSEDVKDFVWQSISQIKLPASSILIGTRGSLDDADLLTTGDLVFDFANGTGDQGLDTGVEANNTWYALYAVPGALGAYKLKASTALPHALGGVGPAGFTKYRYLGIFRNGDQNTQAGDIKRFFKSGAEIFLSPGVGTTTFGVLLVDTSAATATWTKSIGMSGTSVPFSDAIYRWTFSNGGSGSRTVLRGRDSGTIAMWHLEATGITGTGSQDQGYGYVSSLITDVQLSSNATGTVNIDVSGWIDPVLARLL